MRNSSAPGWGALLGFTWAVVAVALIGFLGLAPPDRLLLFSALALGTAAGSVAFTPRQHMRSKRFGAAVTVAAFLAGFALTGVPEYVSGGQGTGPCELRVDTTVPLTTPTRLDTSARSPLDLGAVDTLRWVSTAPRGSTEWRRDLGLRVGGFDLIVVRDTPDVASVELNDGGVVDVAEVLERAERTLGAAPTGAFHVIAILDAPGADCTVNAYLKRSPVHPWDGPLLITLWVLTVAIPVGAAVLAIRQRRGVGTN